jgi:hypothetical protein
MNVDAGSNKDEGSSSKWGQRSCRWRNVTRSMSAAPTWVRRSRRKLDRTSHPPCGATSGGATADDASFQDVGRVFSSTYIMLPFAPKAAVTARRISSPSVALTTVPCTAATW